MAILLEKLGKVLAFLITIVAGILRVIIGGVMVVTGSLVLIVLFFSLGVGLAYFLSLWTPEISEHIHLPIDALSNAFPGWYFIPIVIAPLVILVLVLLLGISLLSSKTVFKPVVWWTLFVLLLIDVAVLGTILPSCVLPFKKSGTHQEESQYVWPSTTPVLKLHDTDSGSYPAITLTLMGHQDSIVRVVKKFRAQGSTRTIAKKNAQMVTYQVQQQDNDFIFDATITFKKDALFRAQRLKVEIYMPFGQVFKIDPDLWSVIKAPSALQHEYCNNNEWEMSVAGLVCAQHQGELIHKKLSHAYKAP